MLGGTSPQALLSQIAAIRDDPRAAGVLQRHLAEGARERPALTPSRLQLDAAARVLQLVVLADEHREQIAHPPDPDEAIGKRQAGLDRVAVATPHALTRDVAGLSELCDDPMGSAFGDSDPLADLSQEHARVARDADEHARMIGQKLPARNDLLGHSSRLAYLDFPFNDLHFLDMNFMLCCSSPRCTSGRWRSSAQAHIDRNEARRAQLDSARSRRRRKRQGRNAPDLAPPGSNGAPNASQRDRSARIPLLAKLTSLTSIASLAAAGIIVVGIIAVVGGNYAKNVVHDQLVPQKIVFPAANSPALLPGIKQYAGQQLVNGSQAKAYANNFIDVHLSEVAGGQTYAQVSAAAIAAPTNAKLAEEKATLFQGETLRSILLSAWGWSLVGTIATLAGYLMIALGALLLLLPLANWRINLSGRGTVAAA